MMPARTFLALAGVFIAGCSSSRESADRWEQMNGPYAQNVSCILADNEAPATLTAGLTNGQVFRSTDNGKTWSRASIIRTQVPIHRILQHPERHSILYAATDAGAFVSTNGGNAWTMMAVAPELPPQTGCTSLAIDPWNTAVLYAGFEGHGLYKSTDGGSRWLSANNDSAGRLAENTIKDIQVDPAKPDYLCVAASGLGILRSTDAGASWKKLTPDYSSTGWTATRVVLKKKTSGTLVYAANSGSIFKSTDEGNSWSPSRYGLESDSVYSLVAQPINPDVLYAGTGAGILVSDDFGSTWRALPGEPARLATCIAIIPGQGKLSLYAYGRGSGLQRTTDEGATWERCDAQLGGSTAHLVRADETGKNVYAAVDNTLLLYQERSGSWLPAGKGLEGPVTSLTLDSKNANLLFAATKEGAFRSSDGGDSWQRMPRSLHMVPTFLDIHPVIHNRMFASGDMGLFVSTDRGQTWAESRPLGKRIRVRSLSFFPSDAGLILGATTGHGVILTSNGGFEWEVVRHGMADPDISSVTFDDTDPHTCYAYAPGGKCYRSLDGGMEWDHYAPPWNIGDTVIVASDRSTPSSVTAVVNGRRVYYSASGGGTWFLVREMANRVDAVATCWNRATGMLYVGARDTGVYRISLADALRKRLGE